MAIQYATCQERHLFMTPLASLPGVCLARATESVAWVHHWRRCSHLISISSSVGRSCIVLGTPPAAPSRVPHSPSFTSAESFAPAHICCPLLPPRGHWELLGRNSQAPAPGVRSGRQVLFAGGPMQMLYEWTKKTQAAQLVDCSHIFWHSFAFPSAPLVPFRCPPPETGKSPGELLISV